MLFVLAAAQLLSSVGFSMIFPFLPNYVADLGSAANLNIAFLIGAVFSSQAITMTISSPIWGSVADRYGRKPMLIRALIGGAVIVGLMGFVQNAEQLVLLRAIQGIITGTVSAGNALIGAIAPRERTGYAMSFLQTASWGGVAVGPLLGGILADSFGFRLSFIITGVLLLAGGIAVVFGVREEFTPPARKSRRSLFNFGTDLLAVPGLRPTFVARFTSNLAKGMLVPILPLFIPLLLHGQSGISTFTGLVIGVSSATGTFAAIVLGGLGDRTGHRRVLIWSGALAALTFLLMAFVTEGWQLLVLNALSGIAAGGLMPALSALIAQYTNERDMGRAFGLDNSVMAAARAVAPLLAVGAGELFGYQSVFVLGAIVFVATILISIRLPEPKDPRRVLTN